MAKFPIEIRKISLHYKRGTSDKEYNFLVVMRADGQSMLMKRWGKTGTWGQSDFEFGPTLKLGETLGKVHREKTRKGYEVTHDKTVVAESETEFRAKLGEPYWAKMTAAQKEFCIHDAAGLEGTPDLDALLDGIDVETESAEIAAAKRRPEPKAETEAERYKDNPLWGAF